jgi:phosphate transport system substrate-binding protein
MRALVLALLASTMAQAEPLRIQGSPMMAKALELAAPAIREELGIELKFDTQTGSAGALQAIGLGTADLAMLLRPMTQEEISAFPAKQPYELEIGVQVLVPIVSRETYETGVKAISRADFVALYEGDLRTWQRLGGEDREIKFFNPAQRRGVWELFVTWLYGDIRKAPLGKRWEIVETNADARNSVEFNTGSISIAPPQWADGRRIFALALREPGGLLEPTPENFLSHKWPITRPLYLVSGDKPTGAVRKVMELMVGPRGQEAIAQAEFLPRPEAAAKLAERLR